MRRTGDVVSQWVEYVGADRCSALEVRHALTTLDAWAAERGARIVVRNVGRVVTRMVRLLALEHVQVSP